MTLPGSTYGIQEQVGPLLVFARLQHDLTLFSARGCIVSALASNVRAHIRAEIARALRIRRSTPVRNCLQSDSLADELLTWEARYWDWSKDWENLTMSSIWSNTDGFGSPGIGESNGISGPFNDVRVRYRDNGTISPHRLARSFLNYDSGEVGSMSGELIKPENMGRLARAEDYDTFRYIIEGTLHNVIHLEVVGDLDELTAPNGMFREKKIQSTRLQC